MLGEQQIVEGMRPSEAHHRVKSAGQLGVHVARTVGIVGVVEDGEVERDPEAAANLHSGERLAGVGFGEIDVRAEIGLTLHTAGRWTSWARRRRAGGGRVCRRELRQSSTRYQYNRGKQSEQRNVREQTKQARHGNALPLCGRLILPEKR